jgi:hypothetical protein
MARAARAGRRPWRVLGALLLAALGPAGVLGQSVTGTILGTVRDSSGGAVATATVTLAHVGTGATRVVSTDAVGGYTAPMLPTGSYSVSAEAPGFERASLFGVRLGVDGKVRCDLELGLSGRAEAVEVQSEPPLLQTSSSDLSTTVEQQLIEALPLNGRNFVSLTRTVPGVLRGVPGANIDGAGGLGWRGSASFSANGQRPRDNNFVLDGVDNNETWLQTVVIFPSIDALDEFKLQTSTYSAEFGRSLGGVVSLQLKSGSNQYRGSAFGFLRDDGLDANNFFNNRAGVARPAFRQHQFGGSAGGPIRKDRTFFFVAYQGLNVRQGANRVATVPSERMRQGDFSELNAVIYDPLTGHPFLGNVIPRERWDPAAANILDQLIPAPNTEGQRSASGQPINNYVVNPELTREDHQLDVKLDHQLSPANRLFLRYSLEKSHRFQPPTFPRGDGSLAGDSEITAQSVALNDTHSFGPRWLNELRVGYSSFDLNSLPVEHGQNLARQMGIPNINFSDYTSGMSAIVLSGRSVAGTGAPVVTDIGNLQFLDNLTHVRGPHTLKLGASVTFRSRKLLQADTPVGSFSFNSNATSNCAGRASGCSPLAATGFDVASFLLGYAASAIRTYRGDEPYTETRPEWAAYLQDDFRVTRRLTLNLGLRWDVFVPWVEQNDEQSNFDPSTGRFVVASEGAVLAGVHVGRYLQTYSKSDLGPRLGFAYDLLGSGRTILRGGFGVFWNWGPGGTSSSKAQNPPFVRSQSLQAAGGTHLSLSDGLPPVPEVDPSLPPAGSTRSASRIDPRDAYAMNWNLDLQQQLGRDFLAEVAYVGSRGGQLVVKTDQNQAPPVVGVTNPNLNRPYRQVSPALQSVGTVETSGTLDYHALQLKLQRRFSHGLSLLAAYTYGRAIDRVSDNDGGVTLTNVYDPGYNRGPADYDVTHTLSASWTCELPFARASRFGGWQANGIVYWRTGLPFTVIQVPPLLSTGVAGRPNRIGGGAADLPTVEQWFDPSAFQRTEPTGTFGSAGRNILRGPRQLNVDLSLVKLTRFGRVETELRAEAFNVFNHPQFAQPNSTLGNAAYGTITSMLSNPACATCGTTERQIQLGLKLRF